MLSTTRRHWDVVTAIITPPNPSPPTQIPHHAGNIQPCSFTQRAGVRPWPWRVSVTPPLHAYLQNQLYFYRLDLNTNEKKSLKQVHFTSIFHQNVPFRTLCFFNFLRDMLPPNPPPPPRRVILTTFFLVLIRT